MTNRDVRDRSGRNWAGNITYGAAAFHEPTTVAQVQAIVSSARRVRALGSRHSFNAVADTEGDHVSLAALERVVDIDVAARTVTVDGGIRYGELAERLHAAGWALANLASLPHITVAGACATGTHGSGVGNGGLATALRGLQLVTATGDLVDVTPGVDPDAFAAMAVGLGAFGIVTRCTLAIEPTYDVRQRIFEGLPFATAIERFDEVMAAGYSVSLFTTWGGDDIEQVWRKERTDRPAGAETFGATPATRPLHPIGALDATPCTTQLGVPGPWHERLPHFRLDHTPSSGDELQSELFVDRADAPEAMCAMRALGPALAPVVQISEVRTIAADDLWLSPAHGRDSVAFHVTWVPSWEAVRPVLALVEDALAPFGPRPHPGKLTTMTPAAVRAGIDRLADVERQLARWDPDGRFRNDHLSRLFG